MAGPWEKYGKATPPSKPWEKYSSQETQMVEPTKPQGDGSTLAPYEPSLFERAMTGLRRSGIVPRANIRDFEAIGAGVRNAADTAAFGFGDELLAAGSTATGISGEFGDFSGNLKNQKARSMAADVHHSKAATIGDVVGLGAGAAGIGKLGLSMAAKATTPGKAIAGAAFDGGFYGTLAGAGNTDGGLEDRAQGATLNAAIGAVAGGGLSALATGGPAIKNYLARRVGKPASQAQARIAQAMTPESAAKLDDLGPEGMVVDALGERGRALARSAANSSPEARELLENASKARMAGQSDRMTDSLLKASRLDQPQTVDDLVQGIRKQAKPAIDRAYAEARSLGHDIDMAAFDDIFQTDMGRKALQQGQRLARDRMAAEGVIGEPSTLAVLDEAKNALDDLARPSLGQGPTNEQAIAGMLAKRLRERTDALTPSYGGARDMAAERYARESAVRLGADGAKPRIPADYADRARAVARTSPDEVAQGYASGKIDQLQNRRDTPGALDTLFGPTRQQDAMQAALGPEGARTVRSQIANERTFSDTHRALTGNSTTVRQLMEQGLLGGVGGAAGLATGGDAQSAGIGALATILARRGGGALIGHATAGREASVAPIIARMLTDGQLPAQLQSAASRIPNKAKQAIIRALMLNAVGPQLRPE